MAVPELNVGLEGEERRALEDVGRAVDRMQAHLQYLQQSAGIGLKIDRSLIQHWVLELRVSTWDISDADQEPSDAWTYEDRWRIVLGVRREMESFLKDSIPSFVTEFQARRWLYRIEMAVCMSHSATRLEAHRRELLGFVDPVI